MKEHRKRNSTKRRHSFGGADYSNIPLIFVYHSGRRKDDMVAGELFTSPKYAEKFLLAAEALRSTQCVFFGRTQGMVEANISQLFSGFQ
jgi:hypothetical protein